MGNCHCTDCRKAHGAAFATFVDVPRDRFEYVQGAEELKCHRATSGALRTFCGNCGALLTWERDTEPGVIGLAAATLDTPVEGRPEYHIFVRSKVPWFDIQDGMPQHAAYPDDS
jgi:hypothetical protein